MNYAVAVLGGRYIFSLVRYYFTYKVAYIGLRDTC